MATIIYGLCGLAAMILLAVLTSSFNNEKRSTKSKNKTASAKSSASYSMRRSTNTPVL